MAKAKGIKEVGYVDVQNHGHADGVNSVHWHDCAGGGQVVVEPLPPGATHPKVSQRIEGSEQVYVTRQGSWFGWFWLTFRTLGGILVPYGSGGPMAGWLPEF